MALCKNYKTDAQMYNSGRKTRCGHFSSSLDRCHPNWDIVFRDTLITSAGNYKVCVVFLGGGRGFIVFARLMPFHMHKRIQGSWEPHKSSWWGQNNSRDSLLGKRAHCKLTPHSANVWGVWEALGIPPHTQGSPSLRMCLKYNSNPLPVYDHFPCDSFQFHIYLFQSAGTYRESFSSRN